MRKSVTVENNDPRRAVVTLNIAGPVERFASITPPRVIFNGKANAPMRTQVFIVPEPRYPFKILSVDVRHGKHIRYRLEPANRGDRPGYRLIVENTRTAEGRYYDTITLATDHPLHAHLNIQVYGNIKE